MASSAPSPTGNTPSSAAPSDEQQAPEPSPSDNEPKQATWVIDINDTQQITDETGIVWNYTLTFHASKPGGTNVTGEFAGEAILKIEPDFASAQAAAAREGTELLAMIFNYHAECESLSFVVEKVIQEEQGDDGDLPLAPLVPKDFSAVSSAIFNSTQEPVGMTIQTDEGPFSGSGGGGGVTIDVPFEIIIYGASVSVFFGSMPHTGVPAFNGTITGDVLPG
jgi:hypothetical protein